MREWIGLGRGQERVGKAKLRGPFASADDAQDLAATFQPRQASSGAVPYAEHRFRIGMQQEGSTVVANETITISPGSPFRAAMVLAIIADALQIIVFPWFIEGALSPADDLLDFAIAAAMVHLLGWQWEFLPSFLAKLVPGVDLVPFWTMAVANVYRKSKRIAVIAEESRQEHSALKDPQGS
jgi:hypothetical protein